MNIYFTLGFITAAFISGCYVTHLYEGNATKNIAIVQERHAAEGETKIIKDTNAIQKVIIHEKAKDCGNSTPPAGITSSLR